MLLAVLGSPIYSLDCYNTHAAVMRPHFLLGHWLGHGEHVVCLGGMINIAEIVGGGGWCACCDSLASLPAQD